MQHYELYALPGSPQTTVFDAATLPNGVKHAFLLADAMEVDVETAEAAAAGAREAVESETAATAESETAEKGH